MGPSGEQDIQSRGISLLFLLGCSCECLDQDLKSLVLPEQQQMVQDEEGHPCSSLCNPLISTLKSPSPQPSSAFLPSFFFFFFLILFIQTTSLAWCLSLLLFYLSLPLSRRISLWQTDRESQLAAPATRGHMPCSQGIRNQATICQLFRLSWAVQQMNTNN